ncbi:CRISPR-associated helicase Cas3' [Abiotrophia defectiva]|jgi:CRISPR-associated helicase cas3|uniref:CRISPR-associated helicase Cas3' n=1 Tax=Abiotrophia defectiva TaxID=46125 RepID=UPI0028F17036|nr:CRISPR-associated helicase Cas3' [Abiotrophia defectiva]
MCFAHYDRESGHTQSLKDHSVNVACMCFERGNEIQQGTIMLIIGLYHDVGKADRKFQDKLMNSPTRHVDHSYAGAKYLSYKIRNVLNENKSEIDSFLASSFQEIIVYVILSHHGIFDIPLSQSEDSKADEFRFSNLMRRCLQYDDGSEYHYEEDVKPFIQNLEERIFEHEHKEIDQLIIDAFDEYILAWEKLGLVPEESERLYYTGMFMRLYLSILKNADIQDTINAFDEKILPMSMDERKALKRHYLRSIEEKYSQYSGATGKINRIRQRISEIVKKRGKGDTVGIYRLDLPTGAGKTNLSIRYAFHQMIEQNMSSFIYVAPFLSILEQNAAEIKEIVGEEGVLEHHSNIMNEQDDEFEDESYSRRLMSFTKETWDSPITLTTMVQFFQTLFKVKSSNIRRFSSLIRGVIVLDEVQSLPLEVTSVFNLSMNFLCKVMEAVVVLCTATQPLLSVPRIQHKLMYGDCNGENTDIISLTMEERSSFERTQVRKFNDSNDYVSIEEVCSEVLEHNQSTLIILNTKKAVEKLYLLIREKTDRTCYYLSTNMCAAHRLDRLEKIRNELACGKAIICVSTQLIEAGVDVDFHRVIRSYAGIDSLIQTCGRCNREGLRDKGEVLLVRLPDKIENVSSLKVIKDKRKVTESILREINSTIDLTRLNDEFYSKYYELDESQEKFDYPVNNTTAYRYLSDNRGLGFEVKTLLKQSFRTGGNAIQLIKDESISIIVPYSQKSKRMIETLELELSKGVRFDTKQGKFIKSLIRKLQRYTVNVPQGSEFISYTKPYLNQSILILSEEYYDEDRGLVSIARGFIY